MNYLMPTIIDGIFHDGSVIKAINRCEYKYCQQPCDKFYDKIKNMPEGFYTCHLGYTVYKYGNADCTIFVVGMRVKGHYNKRNNRCYDEGYYVIQEELFYRLLFEQGRYVEIQKNFEQEREVYKDLLHDVRKIDSLIKSKSDAIIREYENTDRVSHELINRVKNINAMEEVISCKYSIYDLFSNIGVLAMGELSEINIYKKFDKVRYILLGYKNKDVQIDFEGETNYLYKMSISYADVLPFLLLENAIKYTIGKHKVSVVFKEKIGNLLVEIISYGPYCEEDEIDKVFKRNYRGRNTEKYSSEGTGIGLFLAKEICNLFNVNITISSEYVKTINGIKSGWFKVNLIF